MDVKECYIEDVKEATGTERVKQRWVHGMHGADVAEIMNKWKSQCYKGVFSQGELLTSEYLKRVIEEDKPFSLMVSTNYMDGTSDPDQETHWVCIYSDNKGSCDYFDSYAIPPIQEDIVHFLDLIKEGGSVTTNTTALQRMEDKQSRTCGFHCVLFLIMREYKHIGADQIYAVYPQEGQDIHQNDVYATTFYEALLNKNI